MSVTIPDSVLQTARMSENELLMEIAVTLFQQEKLTLGQASNLANMNLLQFQHLLASREINVHYDVLEFDKDLQTLKQLGRL